MLVTSELNSVRIPFKFKELITPKVLLVLMLLFYTLINRISIRQESLSPIFINASKTFLMKTPHSLRKRLAPGMSLAEDPGSDESLRSNSL